MRHGDPFQADQVQAWSCTNRPWIRAPEKQSDPWDDEIWRKFRRAAAGLSRWFQERRKPGKPI